MLHEPILNCKTGQLTNGIKNQNHNDKEANLQADKWLTWACTNRHVSINSYDIPEGILPELWSGELLDCKVFCKTGPDDVIFDENPDIRRMVARGNCFLKLKQPDWTTTMFNVIRGLTKFPEGLGNDNDDGDKWKNYFIKDFSQSRYILSTSKLNGESGHMAALIINDIPYWVGGSKNVTMLFKDKDDIKRYDETIQRYSIAREICNEWMVYVEDHYQDSVRLHAFMNANKLSGNFEFLSPYHQHIEDFSLMTKPQLMFITWTYLNLEHVLQCLNQSSSSSSSYCSPSSFSSSSMSLTMAPDTAVLMARDFKLLTIDVEKVEINELNMHVDKIRCQRYKEGNVLYFLDDDHNVIGIVKKKTVWYIIIRAIREKLRGMLVQMSKKKDVRKKKNKDDNNNNNILDAYVHKLDIRLDEIQNWLKLDDSAVEQWKALGKRFFSWMINLIGNKPINIDAVIKQYPANWKSFLTESDLSDAINYTVNNTYTIVS